MSSSWLFLSLGHPHLVLQLDRLDSQMPEYRECWAHFLFLLWFLQYCQQKSLDLHVLGLWADYVDGKRAVKRKKGRKPSKKEFVFKLADGCKEQRGQSGNQTFLYPQKWHRPISELEWKDVAATPRTIIFDFGALRFQLAYLLHTSIQCFDKKTWDDVVKVKSKYERGYRIGIAFEFQDHVVAFLSKDNIIQPIWENHPTKFPSPPCDVYDYPDFLSTVAAWMDERTTQNRSSYACEVIRAYGKVFGGIGVYTVCEVFFDAGLSPFLTEAEVFDCPSRTARFCEAFWAYAHKSHTDLSALLRPAMVNGIIAPTQEQRLKYQGWLHVYAKDNALLTNRMVNLLDLYNETLFNYQKADIWYRNAVLDWFDVFEPNLIEAALTSDLDSKKHCLGHLIFGEAQWMEFGKSLPKEDDPLTAVYRRWGMIDRPTHLGKYEVLFDNEHTLRERKYRPTYYYRIRDKIQVWSITPAFPENSVSHEGAAPNPPVVEKTGKEREAKLFKTIIASKHDVAIGPLEYCGNGTVIRVAHGKKKASAIRADRQEIIQQAPSEKGSKFRLGYFSPQKDQDPKSEDDDSGAESSDSGDFPVPRRTSPIELEPGTDIDWDPLMVPPSPSPSASTTSALSDGLASNPDTEDTENATTIPPRKKKKKTHHTSADRALVLESRMQSSEGESSKRVRNTVSYARVKRRYTKKVDK